MELNVQLDPIEARLFGVLVEKALTTPEQYPLSVNAATNGANQKSNRDPLMSLDEVEVAVGLERLVKKYMARKVFPGNSRVEKYCHNGKDALNLDSTGLAILAELLMRGPQTLGELRTRCSRMVPLGSLEELQEQLAPLLSRGFIKSLPPAPGSRAERYAQLLCPDSHSLDAPAPRTAATAGDSLADRVAALEARVAQLEGLVSALQPDGKSSAAGQLSPREA
jgi:uncharacterized protein YceH (UPF0502 family)